MNVIVWSLNLILRVKDTHTDFSGIFLIVIAFEWPCSNRRGCWRTQYWEFIIGRRCWRLSRLFLKFCRGYWIIRLLLLMCRSGRVIANWAHRTFKTEIVGGASGSFISGRWRWGCGRCCWRRSNRRSIRCIKSCRSSSRAFASDLGLFRFSRRHRFWNIAFGGRDSRGRVWLSRAVANFEFRTEFLFKLFGVLRNLFLRGFFIGKRAALCILPKICVAFCASSKFGNITIAYTNFGYTRFFNDCGTIRCSYYCTTRC